MALSGDVVFRSLSLLPQRSAEKITFPSYWANTCCSHPLYTPSEMVVDNQMGVKVAAIRKLEQELGIPPEDVPVESFQFLTRVHYKVRAVLVECVANRGSVSCGTRRRAGCASGPHASLWPFFSRCFAQAAYDEVWGEHEVDYILICRPKRMVRLNVNANEVAEVRAFAADELRAWVEGADAR